uniref:TIL domain-containing protein n=1 Tax=Parastrongyloides trichosuri TaxID=131310 RepID=A0A0N4ZVX4_PARTI
MKFFFIQILISIAILQSNVVSSQQCGMNEVFAECSSHCEATCGMDEHAPCILSCGPPKCQCANGFRRDPVSNQCVPPEQCSSRVARAAPMSCGMNEVFVECSSKCEGTCSNQNPTCVTACGPPACQCAKGYVRAPMSGDCIKPKECNAPPKPECGQNAMYVECSTRCEATCEDQTPACNRMCGPPKCQCLQGFVKDLSTGECILPRKCKKQSEQECDKNEELVKCSTACEPSCAEKNPVCVKKCGPPKCQCKEGFFRNAVGHCVKPKRC